MGNAPPTYRSQAEKGKEVRVSPGSGGPSKGESSLGFSPGLTASQIPQKGERFGRGAGGS